MKTRTSTLWRLTDPLHRLAKVVFRCLLLMAALNITPLPAGDAANHALEFDGIDDRVQVGNIFSNVFNNFTIELWANPRGYRLPTVETNGGISLIQQRFAVFPEHGDFSYGAGHAGAGVSIGTNGISVYEHASGYLPSRLVYTSGVSGWTHVALVYSNKMPRLYVNGSLVRSINVASVASFVHPGANLGAPLEGIGYGNYEGQLDEVRIWNAPLGQAQIQTNMHRTLAGDEPNLVVYFRCDEGTGLALTDHAPAEPSVNGVLTDGTSWVPSGMPPLLPLAQTLPASATGPITDTAHGRFNPAGNDTSAWFEWGTMTNNGNQTPVRALGGGTSNTNLSEVLPGVTAGVIYHYRAVASNSAGLVVGADRFFGSGGRTLLAGTLANFDVRYPPSLPNGIEIVFYGNGLRTSDVTSTYTNSQWGKPSSIVGQANSDTNSPAYGLDGVVVRYAGPPLPDQVGALLHFGVQLRAAAVVNHQELWWTINGQRILRPDAPQVAWSYNPSGWLISVANPTPQAIYVYGCRFFPVTNTVPLPTLSELSTSIDPTAFGAPYWTSLNLPGGAGVFCIQPWCRIYLSAQSSTLRPIVFQIAARNVTEAAFPLPPGPVEPNPNDWNGENGTTVILTTRATQESAEDINGDGVVDLGDLNTVLGAYNNGVVNQSALDAVLARYWPDSPWLYMTNVVGLGGTNVTFALTNSLAGAFSVEYTTNLLDWLFLGPATPRYEFSDTNAPAAPQRYYRLRWP